jgi:pimeloyl-ACP methyl ester carboxylesterase
MLSAQSYMIGLAAGTLGLVLYTMLGVYRAERDYPPLGQTVEVEGLRLHYITAGEGPAIVLLHGASATLRDFYASIFNPLAQNHHVIALDRPGYGYSERPKGGWPDPSGQARLVHGALSKLNVQKPILVGHSWSGSVVLAYLLAYPDEVAGGVLIGGTSHPWKGGVAWYNHLAAVPILGDLFARTLLYPVGNLMLDNGIESVFRPNPVTTDYQDRTGVILALRSQSFLANAEDARRLSNFLGQQSRHYENIRTPLLLITGDSDTVVPPWNHAERLAKQVPHAEMVVLANTGHAPHHSHTDRVAQLIEQFARHAAEADETRPEQTERFRRDID